MKQERDSLAHVFARGADADESPERSILWVAAAIAAMGAIVVGVGLLFG